MSVLLESRCTGRIFSLSDDNSYGNCVPVSGISRKGGTNVILIGLKHLSHRVFREVIVYVDKPAKDKNI